MALPETQCEYHVVRVTVCARVCVCVCGKPLCMPVRKSRRVYALVSCVCVCGTSFLSMLGQLQVLMAMLGTQCDCCFVSVTVLCVCVLCVCV